MKRLKAHAVHIRSFAALILTELLSRDSQTRKLSDQQLKTWIDQWADWYVNETDLRSFTAELGWLHTLAHGADVAAVLAMHPGITHSNLNDLLDILLRRVSTVNTMPIQYEDDRMALAAFLLLTLPQLMPEDRLNCLGGLQPLLQPAYGQPRTNAVAFAVQFARALPMFTHYGAKLPDGRVIPVAEAREWRTSLLDVLREALQWAYPDRVDEPLDRFGVS